MSKELLRVREIVLAKRISGVGDICCHFQWQYVLGYALIVVCSDFNEEFNELATEAIRGDGRTPET